MARIPEAEVQRLKDEVAVQRLVEATGVGASSFTYDSNGNVLTKTDARGKVTNHHLGQPEPVNRHQLPQRHGHRAGIRRRSLPHTGHQG